MTERGTPPHLRSRGAEPARLEAVRAGHVAETLAAILLMLKGYRIIARRHRTPQGEVDLIVRRRSTLAFVEVKRRKTFEDAAYAVTRHQQRRIANAARAWLMRHPDHAALDLRFDVVLVSARNLPRHLPAAFEAVY